jgi:hypothetical protein
MPHAARVTPNVPTKTRIIAGGLRNDAGEVPSIIAPPRIPTIAATMPIAVAAFIVPGHRLRAADLSSARKGISTAPARGV